MFSKQRSSGRISISWLGGKVNCILVIQAETPKYCVHLPCPKLNCILVIWLYYQMIHHSALLFVMSFFIWTIKQWSDAIRLWTHQHFACRYKGTFLGKWRLLEWALFLQVMSSWAVLSSWWHRLAEKHAHRKMVLLEVALPFSGCSYVTATCLKGKTYMLSSKNHCFLLVFFFKWKIVSGVFLQWKMQFSCACYRLEFIERDILPIASCMPSKISVKWALFFMPISMSPQYRM